MRLVIDSKLNSKLRSRIPVFLLFFVVFIIFFFMLMPFADAESRGRDPTLRSRLYEAFRCGNGICDAEVMEDERTCPIDCTKNPEAVNASNITQIVLPEPKQKSTGLMPISTIVPSEEIYNNYPTNNYLVPAGEKPAIAESPSRVEMQKESGVFSSAVFLFLIFSLVAIILGYSLRNKVPFFREMMEKLFGIKSGKFDEINPAKREFEQEIPVMPAVSQVSRPKALVLIKKDKFMEGINLLLSKLKKIRQIKLQKPQGMQEIFGKKQVEANDKNNSGIILSNMVNSFKRKGMSLKEIQQRIRRMGLWSEETIKQSIENSV